MQELLKKLTEDQLPGDLAGFAPELALCGTLVVLLLGRLCNVDRNVPGYCLALLGTVIAFILATGQYMGWLSVPIGDAGFFSGLLVYDQWTIFFRLFLLLFLILVIVLTVLTEIPDNEDGPDFYTLLIGATIGLMLMASANHLLILFLAVEMASVPSYVMVGFLKGRRLSSEASLKYVVYGAGAAGVMLYGTSLLAGLLGTASFPELALHLKGALDPESGLTAGLSAAESQTLMLAVLMVLAGLAFKLSLVPFHFWCPDAFEGATAEVAGYLSVASKAAAFALTVRFCGLLVGDPHELYVAIGIGLGVIAAVTATFGNLAAYAQTNIKRLLAYSTIAHAGYMLMGVAAMVVLRNTAIDETNPGFHPGVVAVDCLEGLLFYLTVYLFMNLGAFAIVALIRNRIFSEEIDDYAGLSREAPVLSLAMAICMFSLIGLPPLGGFFAKYFLLYPVWVAGQANAAMYAIVIVALLNTVFSLFYYIRVLKAIYMAPRPEGARSATPAMIDRCYVLIVTIPILVLGVTPLISTLSRYAQRVAHDLLSGS